MVAAAVDDTAVNGTAVAEVVDTGTHSTARPCIHDTAPFQAGALPQPISQRPTQGRRRYTPRGHDPRDGHHLDAPAQPRRAQRPLREILLRKKEQKTFSSLLLLPVISPGSYVF